MSTLTSVGPMIINGMQQPGQPGVPMMAPNQIALSAQYLAPNGSPFSHHMPTNNNNYRTPQLAMPGSSSAPTPTTTTTAAINRSQRCGVCRGCQCKPCGTCTYCQDSPQFGGPGVKKQSCIERRCLRVLENRLQRDAPTFKARVGCNNCDDCRMADCQVCLVCLDKRFFDNRYMTGALCGKKRCNNATSLELPSQQHQQQQQSQQQQQQQQQQNSDRQMMKRSFDATGQNGYDYVMAKRRGMEIPQPVSLPPPPPNGVQIGQPRVMMQGNNGVTLDANGYAQPPSLIRLIPQHQQMQPQLGPHMSLLVPMSSISNSEAQQLPPQSQPQQPPPQPQQQQQQMNGDNNGHSSSNGQTIQINGTNGPTVVTIPHSMGIQNMPQPLPQQNGIYPHFIQNGMINSPYDYQKMYAYPKYEYYDCDPNRSPQDPYVPPSYSGEAKNEIILQPL